jgi:hypothetical protein
MRSIVTAGLLAVLALPAGAQPASAPAAPLSEAAPLSLQSQLGSIPLVSPRAAAQAGRTRMVWLRQPGQEEGTVPAIPCPESGCQQMVSLMVNGAPRAFLADIQFVSHGAYVTLQPRNVVIARVVEFRQGRRGPVFIKGPAGTVLEDRIGYVVVPAASLRQLDAVDDGRTLTSGNVYTRKREPDLEVLVRIEPSAAPQ